MATAGGQSLSTELKGEFLLEGGFLPMTKMLAYLIAVSLFRANSNNFCYIHRCGVQNSPKAAYPLMQAK